MSNENRISFGINLNKKKPNLPSAKRPNVNSSDEDENPKTSDDIKKIVNEKIKREQEANYIKVIFLQIFNFYFLINFYLICYKINISN
jgi:hypothetical protein